jgi:recombination protein RecR
MARLISELERLPGIGSRTAERLATHLLLAPPEVSQALAEAIRALRAELRQCQRCGTYAEEDPCRICSDPSRNQRRIVVVEEPRDLVAIEQSGANDGTYHVLGGRVAPLDGAEVESLHLDLLLRRLAALLAEGDGEVELIIATNPNLEGDHTALHLVSRVQKLPEGERVVISRIATGLPPGSAIEYAHKEVLADAFLGRRRIEPAHEDRR